jgi:protein-disulfide isomerase
MRVKKDPRSILRALTVAALLPAAIAIGACRSSSPAPASAPGASEVVAKIGDRNVTLGDIDEEWRKADASEYADAAFKLYDGRRKALNEIIARQFIAEESKKHGLSPEAYEEAELSKRVAEVTDDEVAAFYAANVREMQGRPIEEVAPIITRYLTERKRQDARQQLVAELRKAGPPVMTALEAPRYDVEVTADDPSYGSDRAVVTIVEFSDYQCPYCLQAVPILKRIQKDYGDRVRVVWKDFPLTQIHPLALKAAQAAHCAGEQDKYWPYHDRLFDNQSALDTDDLRKHAQTLGLDMARFNSCLDSSKYADKVREGMETGNRLGVSSTPTLFINGRVLPGAYPYDDLAAVIEEELARLDR